MCGYPCRRKRSRRRRLRTKKSSVYSVPFQISMSPMILPHLHLRRSKSSSSRGRPRPILSTLLWPQVRRGWGRGKNLFLGSGRRGGGGRGEISAVGRSFKKKKKRRSKVGT